VSAFLDTNVLVYWVDQHPFADRVEQILEEKCVISSQVLNEFANVMRNKRKMDWAVITDLSNTLQRACKVCDVSALTHRSALYFAQRYQLSFYDACIVAAAAQMRCETLYSQDMQNGLNVQIPASLGGGSLSITNPFL
jgi:predicted nucleic acid-binding protein